ncbi:hypothetical protein EMIHUDRAFT_212524 [Emiliania huxleyi CCMP1516]|uniref:Uncharacterized protein n=2 Tax=Emiliania huxleyi TaxID=2903 RepID=A0A0D3IQC4_EMIH1|nr:hypothetical protein EMIHUDRAFT_212524 [Emiliania huxleyi CCMP1516]EOD13459.1 hypothetical protein EMIHUDRAFT_212524 [Emiliania huxleyi CCMP1516]|eukprot:XP_005765888.1 hypothetical protein EMIHUDRAFT_212524 [Emiliania huxleyi CCMP1516]
MRHPPPNRPEPAEHSSPGSVESAPELPGLPNLAGDFGEAGVAAGHDDIAAVTSTLRNIRLGFARDAAATRVQRAMRAGTFIITILITKIQAAARGLITRTSLNNFFKACPPSGRTADLFLSRVYVRGCDGTIRFCHQHEAAQAAALGRYRLVNAWFYPCGDWYTFYSGMAARPRRRDKRERSDRSSDDSSSDQDSCGTGSTSEANDIFDTLDDHLGYGSDSGSGW